MTDKKTEALKLSLEALEYASTGNRRPEVIGPAITAIREALAEQPHCDDCGGFDPECPLKQQQEPVACADGKQCKHGAWCTETYCQEHCEFRTPPASKPWVGLTDEEVITMSRYDLEYAALIGEVQRKLKEKNT